MTGREHSLCPYELPRLVPRQHRDPGAHRRPAPDALPCQQEGGPRSDVCDRCSLGIIYENPRLAMLRKLGIVVLDAHSYWRRRIGCASPEAVFDDVMLPQLQSALGHFNVVVNAGNGYLPLVLPKGAAIVITVPEPVVGSSRSSSSCRGQPLVQGMATHLAHPCSCAPWPEPDCPPYCAPQSLQRAGHTHTYCCPSLHRHIPRWNHL